MILLLLIFLSLSPPYFLFVKLILKTSFKEILSINSWRTVQGQYNLKGEAKVDRHTRYWISLKPWQGSMVVTKAWTGEAKEHMRESETTTHTHTHALGLWHCTSVGLNDMEGKETH